MIRLLNMRDRILSFMGDMATNDAECISKWFTDESILWIPPALPIKGVGRIKALFRAMFCRYEYLQWTIVDIMPVCEDRCIHICTSEGKLKGSPAYNNQVITDITFNKEGKILSLSDYFKDTAVFCR